MHARKGMDAHTRRTQWQTQADIACHIKTNKNKGIPIQWTLCITCMQYQFHNSMCTSQCASHSFEPEPQSQAVLITNSQVLLLLHRATASTNHNVPLIRPARAMVQAGKGRGAAGLWQGTLANDMLL